MTNLLYSWKEGLSLLAPRNLKPFALVTLKSIIEGTKLYLKYFWWIPVIYLGRELVVRHFLNNSPIDTYSSIKYCARLIQSDYVRLFLYGINAIALWLVIRPSIDRKNCAYFRSIISRCFLAFIILLLINTLGKIEFSSLLGIWYMLTVFFVTDTPDPLKNILKSCWRALLMLFYNLPILSILLLIYFLAFGLFHYLLSAILECFVPYNSLLMLKTVAPIRVVISEMIVGQTILTCTVANIYIKRVYEQCDLYFKPQECK
jgi:hypothetical protein